MTFDSINGPWPTVDTGGEVNFRRDALPFSSTKDGRHSPLKRDLAWIRRWIEIAGTLSALGLCLDFGNWTGPQKYHDLHAIAAYAESCHAKAHFSYQNELDTTDYTQCLEITAAANFAGPYTLIYSGPDDDEWARLAREMQIVHPYLS